MASPSQNASDIDRHEDWLRNHEERLRAVELNQAKSGVKLAILAAVASAIMSGAMSLLVAGILALIRS